MLHTRPQIKKRDEMTIISFGIEVAPPAGRGGGGPEAHVQRRVAN